MSQAAGPRSPRVHYLIAASRRHGHPTGPRRATLPEIRLHDFRHTHATSALRAGVHPKVVSERLGHASIGITLDVYSHVMPGMQEEAAEKIDAGLRAALAG
ncbi:MAG TPA: tyrosine-type recombinase/integrase [Candidatus Limnocylindrales bacterium]